MPSVTQLVVIPFLALSLYWLAPRLATIPTPDLPSRELHLLSNKTVDAGFGGCRRVGTVAPDQSSIDDTRGLGGAAERLEFCEDAAVWTEAGVALISCDPGRGEWNTVMGPLKDPNPRGKLYAYHYAALASATDSPTTHQLYPVELHDFPPSLDFHPLAVDFHPASSPGPSSKSLATVFIVNHRRDRGTVEVFTATLEPHPASADPVSLGDASVTPSTETLHLRLSWKRSLAHPKIWTPNSIAPLTHNSFLMTNDHWFTKRKGPILAAAHTVEGFAALPGGSIEYVSFDEHVKDGGVQVKTLARGISFANGIALGPDGKTLAVAETTQDRLRFYSLSPSTPPTLKYEGHVPLDFGPDNVKWTPLPFNDPSPSYKGGELLVAGHAHPLSLVKFAANPRGPRDNVSPGSAVVRIVEGGRAEARYVLRDDGRWFASSATGLGVGGGRVVVTGLYERGILDCKTR